MSSAARFEQLESEVAELREQLDDLRLAFTRLKRELNVGGGSSRPAGGGQRVETSSEDSFSVVSQPDSGYHQAQELFVNTAALLGSQAPRAAAQPSPATALGGSSSLIADEIGRWLQRALGGEHRGLGGREKLPLGSRLWVVARDYSGRVFSPVRVFRTWGSCKNICKQHQLCGDAVFVGFPSEREAQRAVATAGLLWPETLEQ
eukprot:s810_g4.t1